MSPRPDPPVDPSIDPMAESSSVVLPDLVGRRVVRTDAGIDCADIDAALRAAGAELILLPGAATEAELAEAVTEADLLLSCYAAVSRAVLEAATRLRGVVKYGVGIDAIDVDAAIELRIPVVNVPDYGERTVAEAAFCLCLALAKRLVPVHAAVQRHGWIEPVPEWLGSDIAGRSVGLVGFGRIGRAFARMAGAGFGARVIAFDPGVSRREMERAGVEKVDDLHTLLAQADVVSLHCVLTPATRGLVGAAEFAAMARRPIFVNVSRGALVDEGALIDALDGGQVRAAGLDTFRDEPLDRHAHPLATLFGRDNVILLPHLAFYTHEAMARLTAETLARSAELLTGEPVLIRSDDPRLRAQREGVRFAEG